jgi:hypothetical protein
VLPFYVCLDFRRLIALHAPDRKTKLSTSFGANIISAPGSSLLGSLFLPAYFIIVVVEKEVENFFKFNCF